MDVEFDKIHQSFVDFVLFHYDFFHMKAMAVQFFRLTHNLYFNKCVRNSIFLDMTILAYLY